VRKARTKEFPVLVSQEVGSFIQFEDGVVEIVASKLMTGFF